MVKREREGTLHLLPSEGSLFILPYFILQLAVIGYYYAFCYADVFSLNEAFPKECMKFVFAFLHYTRTQKGAHGSNPQPSCYTGYFTQRAQKPYLKGTAATVVLLELETGAT